MSHNIQVNDKVVSILGTEWHKLAIHKPEFLKDGIPFEESELDWEVVEHEIFWNPDKPAIEGWKAINRKDLGLTINIAKKSYAIIQNKRVFEALENALTGINYRVTSTGSLGNCSKIFICVELKDHQDYLVNKDKFKNFVTFVSSHDGSMAFEAYDTAVRTICQNTLNWSRLDKGTLNLRVFHTKNAEMKITRLEEEIEKLLIKREGFYKTYTGLCTRPISLEDSEKLLAGWIAPIKAEHLSTRAYNQTQDILHWFKNGKGNGGKTAADLLNGVTEYYTHYCSDDDNKRFLSNMGGNADNSKLDFWTTINGEWEEYINRGRELLENR